jgi:2-oxoglutarate ferredoxin oxidoreductase subunit beta
VNNAIYGMTGGQMAPTTLPGQIATTCPTGRDVALALSDRVVELLATLRTPAYRRVSVHEPKAIMSARGHPEGLQVQIDKTCYSLIEWSRRARPDGEPTRPGVAGRTHAPYFPLGDVKTPEAAH